MLDREICDRARTARDARFDGRFVSGVLTTRIYCRPVCPVRPARSANVIFFPTAAAAETAGFRPCMRCRPEAAPGSAAWRGTAATVSRALRLIDQGALDEGHVVDLATALGVGTRHLTRLFLEHVGAPPTAAARTRRVQLAKMLLSESRLPMIEVAFAAGFRSVRRFNAVFRQTYRRPPSSIRRADPAALDGDGLTLRLAYCPPLGWAGTARRLAAECTPGVEDIGPGGYRRTVAIDGRAGWLSLRPVAGLSQVELRLQLPDYQPLRAVIERVSHLLDLSADPEAIAGQLAGDGGLGRLRSRLRAVRLPGAWDGFEVAVHRVLRRHVGAAGTRDAAGRLARALGRPLAACPPAGPDRLFPEPAALAAAGPRVLGLSAAAARDLRRLGDATAGGAIQFQTATFDALVAQLEREARFDRATAHWIAMRSLAEPDAVLGGLNGPAAVSERWRPWRSYVALCQATAARAAAESAPRAPLSRPRAAR
jgi:AraC family transcriptional regulator of adaptative response / DNA-3-methyladenine glycosylase II